MVTEEEEPDEEALMVPQVKVAEDGSLIIDEERSVDCFSPALISSVLSTVGFICSSQPVPQSDCGSPARQRAKPGS